MLVAEAGGAVVGMVEALLLRRTCWAEVLAPPRGSGPVREAAGAAGATGPPPASATATGTPRAVRVWSRRVATPAWGGAFAFRAFWTEERARAEFCGLGEEILGVQRLGFL